MGCEKDNDTSFPQNEIKSPVTLFHQGDGLPSSGIYAVVEDTEGNIWISTYSGLALYDGKEFHAVFEGHAGWDVITVAPDGKIWFGGKYTFWDPHCWDGVEMIEYRSYESMHETLGEGDRYFFTRREIHEYYQGTWHKYRIPWVSPDGCSLDYVFLDSKGKFWVTMRENCETSLFSFDRIEWEDLGYKYTKVTDTYLAGDYLHKILETKQNELILSACSQIMKIADGQLSIYLDLSENFGPVTLQDDFFEDSNGKLWFDLVELEYEGEIFTFDGESIGRLDLTKYERTMGWGRVITCIAEDRNGDMWIGTSDGLFHIDI